MVVVLFVALGLLGLVVAARARDRFALLVAIGITTWFVVQAFVNIGAVIGLLPITGVPLPFVSFGGSSLLVNLAAAGLLLNIARHPVEPAPAAVTATQAPPGGASTRPADVRPHLGDHRRRRHGRTPAPRPRRRRGARRRRARPRRDPLRRQRPGRGGGDRARRRLHARRAARPGHPAPAHARQPRRRRGASCAALFHGDRDRPPAPSRRRRRARRLRQRRLRAGRRAAGGCRSSCSSRTSAPARPTGSWVASPRRRRCPSRAPTCRGPRSPATRSARRSGRSTAAATGTAARADAGPAGRPHRRRRVRRVARLPPDQRSGARRAVRLGRPRRPRHPPRDRRAGPRRVPSAPCPTSRPAASSTSRCATRTAWTCCSPPSTSRVTRAGGGVAELAAVGLPAILVPLPIATRDHQTANAQALADVGAAVVVPDAELHHRAPRRRGRRPGRRPRPARRDGRGDARRRPSRRRRAGGPARRGERPRGRAVADAADDRPVHAATDPHRRRRRRRHERDRHPCSRRWATAVTGSDLTRLARRSSASAAQGVSVAVGHDAANLRRTLDAVAVSTAIPATNPEVVGRRRAAASPCCGGPRSSPPSRRRAARWRWRAPTARPRPRRCSPSCSREAGLRPVVHHRRRGHRPRHRRGLGRRRAVRGRGRRERRHVPRARRRRSRSSPTSSPTTSSTTATSRRCGTAFARFLAEAPGPRVVCADDPVGPRRGRRRRRASPTAPTRRPTTGWSTSPPGATAAAGRSSAPGERLGDRPPARARAAQRPQRRRRRRDRPRARRPVRRRRRGARPLHAASPGASSCGASAGGVTFVDDYAHLPTEVARRARRRRGRRAGGGSSCVFQPHRYSRTAALWRDFGDAFDDADVLVVTDVYAAGEAPRPGVTGQARRRRRARRAPHRRAVWLPSARRPRGVPRGRAAAGRPLPHARRRRPDHAAGPADRGHRPAGRGVVVTASPDGGGLAAVAAALGDRAEADVPLGPLTTYRVGGPAAAVRRPSTTTQRAGRPGAGRGRGGRAGARGRARARTCSWPTPGSTAWPSVLGERVRRRRPSTGTVVRAGGAATLPVVARRTAAAGLTGFEWAVGVPGSIGGAVRMNAGGHGVGHGGVAGRGSASWTWPPGRMVWCPPPTSTWATGTRRSAPSQVVVWAELRARGRRPRPRRRPRSARSSGGGASTSRAAANAGSVFTNPPGDSAGRLIDAAGLQGPAGRHRRGVAEARQLHPGRRRRLAPTTCGR